MTSNRMRPGSKTELKNNPGTDPFDAFLQLVVNEERQVLGRPRVEVEEVLKVAGDGLLEEPVVVERLLQEAVEARLEVQQALRTDS